MLTDDVGVKRRFVFMANGMMIASNSWNLSRAPKSRRTILPALINMIDQGLQLSHRLRRAISECSGQQHG